MDNPKKPTKREIKLHIPPDVDVIYSNLAILSSTKHEMIFDIAQMLPPDPRAKVQARVVMSVAHAKLLLTTLQRNIEQYEAKHGTIPVDIPPSLADQLFSGLGDDSSDE